MKKSSPVSFSIVLSQAVGAATSLPAALAAWAVLEGHGQGASEWMKEAIEVGSRNAQTVVVDIMDQKGLWSPSLAQQVFSKAMSRENHALLNKLLDHEVFSAYAAGSLGLSFVSAAVDAPASCRVKSLQYLLSQRAYPPQELTQLLSEVILKAKGTSPQGWEEVAALLIDHGANPMAPVRFPGSGVSSSTLAYLASHAIEYPQRGACFLKVLAQCVSEEAILSHKDRNHPFVPLWMGGEGSLDALLAVLEGYTQNTGLSWLDEDRFFVLSDALKEGPIHARLFDTILKKSKQQALSSRLTSSDIPSRIEQAFNQAVVNTRPRGNSIFDTILQSESPEKRWSERIASLACLCEDPQRWINACQQVSFMIQSIREGAVGVDSKRTWEEIVLECVSAPVSATRLQRRL